MVHSTINDQSIDGFSRSQSLKKPGFTSSSIRNMRKEKSCEYDVKIGYLGSGIPKLDVSEMGDLDSISSEDDSDVQEDEDDDRISISKLDRDDEIISKLTNPEHNSFQIQPIVSFA